MVGGRKRSRFDIRTGAGAHLRPSSANLSSDHRLGALATSGLALKSSGSKTHLFDEKTSYDFEIAHVLFTGIRLVGSWPRRTSESSGRCVASGGPAPADQMGSNQI